VNHKEPIVDVRLFKNLNFSIACLVMFMLGHCRLLPRADAAISANADAVYGRKRPGW